MHAAPVVPARQMMLHLQYKYQRHGVHAKHSPFRDEPVAAFPCTHEQLYLGVSDN